MMDVSAIIATLFVYWSSGCDAFSMQHSSNVLSKHSSNTPKIIKTPSKVSTVLDAYKHDGDTDAGEKFDTIHGPCSSRRDVATSLMVSAVAWGTAMDANAEEEKENMFAPGFVQSYPDFTVSPSGGWSYKDVSPGTGSGPAPRIGDRVVFDWSGYTIGYFGRPFEAKGGPQGGAFDKDLDYFRAVLGQQTVVPALEEAFQSMKPGQVRQVIVPYGKYGYPQATDPKHEQVGPKPTTFSGQRALNFVLDNPRVDRTLLFNVKLIRIDRPDGKGGFVRGDKA